MKLQHQLGGPVPITIDRLGGFTGNVTITPPSPPQEVRAKPNASIATTGASVAFKLKIGAGAPTGPQQPTFSGMSDGGQSSTVTLTLNIQ